MTRSRPVLAEVDVEVGHRHALGIEEALEQQRVAQRIEAGDAERVRDERAGAGAAARSYRHAVRLRPVDEVRDDQEVAGEAHLDDGLRLELETLDVFGAAALAHGGIGKQCDQLALEPGGGLAVQEFVERHAGRRGEVGQRRLAEGNREAAALRDRDGVGKSVREIGERRRHLGLRLEILVRREAARPARIGEHVAFGDAHAGLVRAEVVAPQELHRMRGDDAAARARRRGARSPRRARHRRRAVRAALRGSSGRERAPPIRAPPGPRRSRCPAAVPCRRRRRARRRAR